MVPKRPPTYGRSGSFQRYGLVLLVLAIFFYPLWLPKQIGKHSLLNELNSSASVSIAKGSSQGWLKGGKSEPTLAADGSDPQLWQEQMSTETQSENGSPDKSSPPNAIDLFSIDDPAIQNRHKCIERIRSRHDTMLAPLIGSRRPDVDGKSHVLLVDPAYHANVGDHMLTLGELEFLRRLGYVDSTIQQCHFVQANHFYPLCDDEISAAVPSRVAGQAALWHAGGNWGDLWRDAQWPRIASFEALLAKNYSIVGMPQSLHYNDADLEASDTESIRINIAEGLGLSDPFKMTVGQGKDLASSRVTFTWREHESFEKANRLYPYVNNIIVPDIAFQLGPYAKMPPLEDEPPLLDILVFLRSDHESKYDKLRDRKSIRNILTSIPGGSRKMFTIVDWSDRLERFQSDDIFFTDTSIRLLSMGRVVICDRLHAAILAYLTGIPFVYIDQSTGKISKTLRVAFESWSECTDGDTAMWARATDLTDALEKAIQFIDKYKL